MNTAPTFAAAPAASTTTGAGTLRRIGAWTCVLIMIAAMSMNGMDYGKSDNIGTGATVFGGALLMLAAYKNWALLWNWFGRFLRTSLGEKRARVALGLIGFAFATGGMLGTLAR